jgi:hypothetical protein
MGNAIYIQHISKHKYFTILLTFPLYSANVRPHIRTDLEHTSNRRIPMTALRVSIKKSATGLALAVVFAATALTGSVSAANVTFNSTPDCDDNAIMRCGAMSVSVLQQKYNADTKAQTVYSSYGITKDVIDTMGTTAVAGSVNKDGTVTVDGKVVANGAVSAGYHKMTGSTQVVQNGVTFYNTAPATSFVASKIDAYVVLNKDGQFVTAVLASCGNPVKANNVVEAPKPVEQPKPVEEQPKPVEQPAPVEQPVTPVVVQPAAVQTPAPVLVETGPASLMTVGGLFTGVSALGAAGHAWISRRRNQ